jgi:hypothetical protein
VCLLTILFIIMPIIKTGTWINVDEMHFSLLTMFTQVYVCVRHLMAVKKETLLKVISASC